MSILHRAKFVTSAAKLNQLPPPGPPEVCFVGRSNAGKSSAINILTNQKRLAFSSKTPGRTRLINMFGISDPLSPDQAEQLGYLVDLPGYGFASVSHEAQQEWDQVLGRYLTDRPSLAGIVMLLDIRRGLTKQDELLTDWIAPSGKPLLVLLTKADKLPYGQRQKAVFSIQRELKAIGQLQTIPFSATHRIGIEEADHAILNWISPQAVP